MILFQLTVLTVTRDSPLKNYFLKLTCSNPDNEKWKFAYTLETANRRAKDVKI